MGNFNLVVFFVVVVAAAVFAGVPIAFAFGLAALGYVMLTTSTPVLIVVGRMDEGVSHLILLSVPLFVFLGQLIEMTCMARAMVGFLASLLGHVRGGPHYVLLGAMYLVSGISGSKAADMAAVAPVLFPAMIKRGAKEGDLVALLAATGAQTETIPPSIVLITIGSVTGVSIAALFTDGRLPGAVLAVTLMAVVWVVGADRKLTRWVKLRSARTKEIKTLIGASAEKVQSGSRLVADAGAAMNEILDSVQCVSDIIGGIAAAADGQSRGIAQVSTSVGELDRMTQQNAALVEQAAAAAESLKDQATNLSGVVGNFKLAV